MLIDLIKSVPIPANKSKKNIFVPGLIAPDYFKRINDTYGQFATMTS